MTDEPLLTLRQVADELHLPESTLRYYRDAFLDHIPSIGTGRRRRYPPPAVAVLRSVADGYAAGRSREAILGTLEGATPRPATGAAEKPHAAHRPASGVSNLELLAAIVDGEREQRDALWQMAKEIVRLTDVLEGQDKVLTEIADHAGVRPALSAAQPPKALVEGPAAKAPPAPPPMHAAPPPPPAAAAAAPWTPPLAPMPVSRVEPPSPAPASPPFVAPPPLSRTGAAATARAPVEALSAPELHITTPPATPSDMERLRTELDSERQLVERLREAKVKLEHRVTDAESELEERRPRRRSSVLGRFLKPGE
jgi:DNA-binding transcriptional MerR regulator